MGIFTGTDAVDQADATTGAVQGFTGGTSAELSDSVGDTFLGLAGNDSITAGSGDDRLFGGLGADVLRGGAGSDTIDFSDNWGAVFINLTIGRGYNNAAEGDTYESIENVTGSIFNDWFLGNPENNIFDGGEGDDTMIGYLGADAFIGGDGFDLVRFDDNAGAVFINLITGRGFNNAAEGDTFSGIEGIVGSNFGDYIILNSDRYSNNPTSGYVDGGDGNDFLFASNGDDTLIGGAGEDTVSFQNDTRGRLIINLADGLSVGENIDTLDGIENVIGSPLGDNITGDSGNNVIGGGFGRDSLTGGGGIDTFLFDTTPVYYGLNNTFNNIDNITDFTSSDFIYLSRSAYSALTPGALSSSAFTTGTTATTADHRIIYDTATGNLFYDSDGSGSAAQVQFAILTTAPTIGASEFFVIG